jgi:N utilization substance protein B
MSKRKTSFIFKRGEKMTRRELRENVFKMLFRVEFFDAGELSEQLVLFGEEVDHVTDKDFQYIAERYRDIYNHLSEIDEAINEVAKGWKTTRMGKVDLALIRLAVYEIRYDDEIPFKVAVNEAVELAKQYGTNESPAFVNGILAKFAE